MIGRTLSHFKITAKLGEGGMGEVYRAEDTRLGRDVAIKVLPAAFTEDPKRFARFEREAHVLASLNHPNIAAIYDLAEDQGTHFLVLELAEGEDLEARLSRGPVAVESALPLALQIAQALEAAHEKHIIHRDLKPANVMVAPDGKLKVLDFGLAKAWSEGSDENGDLSDSPTLTAQTTQAGIILGTAAYMSPEQARGQKVDYRADIWSFGVLLLEMVTGTKTFAAATVSDTLAAVLRADLELETLPASLPKSVRRLLTRCLTRDSKHRLQHIGDARLELQEAMVAGDRHDASAPAYSSLRKTLAVGLAALLVGLLLGSLATKRLTQRGADEPSPRRVLTLAAGGRQLLDNQAISPDGSMVAYTAGDQLWIRSLADTDAQAVPNSDGAIEPFWAPDSDLLGFATRDALWRVDIRGGTPSLLAKLPAGEFDGATWGRDGQIIVGIATGGWTGTLTRVSAQGGELHPYLVPDRAEEDLRPSRPLWLPDGRTLLFLMLKTDLTLEIVARRDADRKTLAEFESEDEVADFTYAPSGHILYSHSTSEIRALPFSIEALEIIGEPIRLAVDARKPSIAADGSLVYSRLYATGSRLAWTDRQGRLLDTPMEAAPLQLDPQISPDGTRALVRQESNLWLLDLVRGSRSRLTFAGAGSGAWSPEGDEVAFSMTTEGIWIQPVDQSGSRRVFADQKGAYAPDYSPDGRYIAYYVVGTETQRDLWYKPVGADGEPELFLATPFNENLPKISPDGDYVAYQSDETGRWEIYIKPFPSGDGRWQISSTSGRIARWNPRGGELFYLSGDDLLATEVSTDPDFTIGETRRLFTGADVGTSLLPPDKSNFFSYNYDVSPDGQRFLIVQGINQGTSEIILVQNGLP